MNESRSINILGAASDTAIALVLIYLLHQSRTGFKRSETIINRLILFTINTGALTSLCALVSLITVCNAFHPCHVAEKAIPTDYCFPQYVYIHNFLRLHQ